MIGVTGSTGLAGSHVLLALSKNNASVKAFYRDESKIKLIKNLFDFYNQRDDFSKIQWIKGDLLDDIYLDQELRELKQIYHCAGFVSFDPKDRFNLMKGNKEVTRKLINYSIKNSVKEFGYIGSVSVLKSEDSSNPLISNYARAKKNAELEVLRGAEEGLNTVIINPATIIGPGDISKGSLSIFNKVISGFRYYTNGINGFIDADDLASCFTGLMSKGKYNKPFTIVGENLVFKDLFDGIAKHLGIKPPSVRVGTFLGLTALYLDWAKSLLTGKKRFITKETFNIAFEQRKFYVDETIKSIHKKFHTIDRSIKKTVDFWNTYYASI